MLSKIFVDRILYHGYRIFHNISSIKMNSSMPFITPNSTEPRRTLSSLARHLYFGVSGCHARTIIPGQIYTGIQIRQFALHT
jgi:hypothetical protein